MKELIDSQKLDVWLKKNRNVLFIGRHGVGKTCAVIETFERAGLKWLYFSASTCDPFIDFIGVPRIVEENGVCVLKMVRQAHLEDDSVEAIFIDEYNRGKKAMKNAVMELIQFKSVNGRVYPNLKVVWAAVNPDDNDEYDVEPLDPAQKDRFHVKFYVDYRPCPVYLENRYGEEVTKSALEWWNKLPSESVKTEVSPRNLCYALDWWKEGEDVHDMLPDSSNPSRLLNLLNSKPVDITLKELWMKKSEQATKAFINVDNNLMQSLDLIKNNAVYTDYFLPHLYNERLSSLMNDEVVYKHVLNNVNAHFCFQNVCQSILTVNLTDKTNDSVANRIKADYVKQNIYNELLDPIIYDGVKRNAVCYIMENTNSLTNNLITISTTYPEISGATEGHKVKIWNMILANIPSYMVITEAVAVAKLIERVTTSAQPHKKAWLKYPNWIEVVNQVSKTLFSHGMAKDEIIKLMPNAYKELAFEKEDECFIHPRK